MTSDGSLGPIHYVTASRLNLGLHRNDANVIWDLASHDFSVLFHVLGEQPVAVQTMARSVVRPDIPETAFMNLEFASGAIASVTVSWRAPRKVRHMAIVGERQMVIYDDAKAEEPVKVYDRGVVIPDSASFGDNQLTYRYGDTTAPYVATSEPLANEIAHFLACIETGATCRSDARFAIGVVDALAAADESWMRGGTPVELAPVTL
jgi:predicted dehydrogenase